MTQQKIITFLEVYLSKDSTSMFFCQLSWKQTSCLPCNPWRIFANSLLVTSYDHCLQDLSLCRVLPLPQGLHDIFAQIELSLFSSLHATIDFFSSFPAVTSQPSAMFHSASTCQIMWCFLCLTCLWSPYFNSSLSMRFGFLSFTLSCRLAP